jgi:hypothetical protein
VDGINASLHIGRLARMYKECSGKNGSMKSKYVIDEDSGRRVMGRSLMEYSGISAKGIIYLFEWMGNG